MKLALCSSSASLSVREAHRLPANFTDASSLPERFSSIRLAEPRQLADCSTKFLFEYDVFPRYIMKHDSEWKQQKRSMKVGDIIIQRAIMPPIGFGVCMEFAVRIRGIFEEENRVGFSYETLNGHAERGISEFYFERRSESLFFTIHTYSEPGHWSSRMLRFLALPYQAWCTRRALDHVQKTFISKNRG
ncbi:MAG: DUF1990 family protein [Verrucomicrobiota bacterium]